jgi:hypothetical protein
MVTLILRLLKLQTEEKKEIVLFKLIGIKNESMYKISK